MTKIYCDIADKVLIKEGESVSKNTLLITFNTKSLKAKKEGFDAKLNEKKITLNTEKEILKELQIELIKNIIQKKRMDL